MNQGFNRWIPLVFAVVFSSLLFGFVHGVYGFLLRSERAECSV